MFKPMLNDCIVFCNKRCYGAIHGSIISIYGLQAGVFLPAISIEPQQTWDQLEVEAVIIGDIPSWRMDHMLYGGVKTPAWDGKDCATLLKT